MFKAALVAIAITCTLVLIQLGPALAGGANP
jgi:hypothetical protein